MNWQRAKRNAAFRSVRPSTTLRMRLEGTRHQKTMPHILYLILSVVEGRRALLQRVLFLHRAFANCAGGAAAIAARRARIAATPLRRSRVSSQLRMMTRR